MSLVFFKRNVYVDPSRKDLPWAKHDNHLTITGSDTSNLVPISNEVLVNDDLEAYEERE